MTHRLFSLSLAPFVLAAAAGCSNICEQVGRQRDALTQPPLGPGGSPHIIAAVPFNLINSMAREQVEGLEPRELTLPGIGRLAGALGPITAHIRDLTLGPAEQDELAISFSVSIGFRDHELLVLHLRATVEPRIDPERGTVTVAISPGDIEQLTPELGANARERVTGVFRRILPPPLRAIIPPSHITTLAETVIARAWPLVRRWVGSAMGPLARYEATLPSNVPIERIQVWSLDEHHLIISLWLAMAIPDQETGFDPGSFERSPGSVTLATTGPALAALGNWAMTQGRVPSRFDRHGQPDPNGELEAVLGWFDGPRPLRVHLFKQERPCLRAVLSATPQFRVEDDQIQIQVDDGALEELEGQPRYRLGARFSGLWRRVFEVSQSLTSSTTFQVGAAAMRAEVANISTDESRFVAEVELNPVDATP